MVLVYFVAVVVVVFVVDNVELDVFVAVRLYGRNRENLMGCRILVKWFVKE